MAIHHSQIKKAERLGFTLADIDGSDYILAHWPKRNVRVYGVSPTEAIAQMEAVQAMYDIDDDVHIENYYEDQRLVFAVKDGKSITDKAETPFQILQHMKGAEPGAELYVHDIGEPGPAGELAEEEIERINGIPVNGAIAYKEGVSAADCPYNSEGDPNVPEGEDDPEYDNFVRWNDEWDEAADNAGEEETPGGSVVNSKYRAIYAERGHPTHCGDWLATTLNNLCLVGKTTDLDLFEAICTENGVDLSKYNRTTGGWQGRLRMTGRNLLAKRVYLAGGVLKMPEGHDPDSYRAPADWMEAQRFKMPKAEQAKPIPEAAE